MGAAQRYTTTLVVDERKRVSDHGRTPIQNLVVDSLDIETARTQNGWQSRR